MTLSVNTRSGSFVADGLATPRSINFRLIDNSDLHVTANGIPQTLNVHYQLVGAYPAMQMVPLAPFWANGVAISYERITPPRQLYEMPSGVPMQAKTLEAEMDRNAMVALDQKAIVENTRSRALLAGEGETAGLIPPLVEGVGKYLLRTTTGWIWSLGTGADAGLRQELAGETGAEFVIYKAYGADAIARAVRAKLGEIISVADYGVSPAASPLQNLSRFKKAVAAAIAVRGTLLVPATATPTVIDTSGGLSAAIEVNGPLTIRLEGDLKASFSALQDNPPYLLNFTAEYSGIEGPGRLIGDGAINDLSTAFATAERTPGLVRLAANNTFCRGVTFVDPPKAAVMVYTSFGCEVTSCRVVGGVKSYHSTADASQTAHFGIYLAGGGRHLITDNKFEPDAVGGMVIQCIFGFSSNCTISRNYAYRPYEKLTYIFGSGHLVSCNTVIGNSGIVPGTNMEGTVGGVIRFHGSDNRISGNYIANCGAGVVCWDGTGNQIVDNSILDCPVGIAVVNSAGGGPLSRTKIEGNNVTFKGLAGHLFADGIEVTSVHPTLSEHISVKNNTVNGFSRADPTGGVPVWQANRAYSKISLIKPTVGNGRVYAPIATGTGGVTGATEPTWPTTPGATVVDGTVTWVAIAYGGLRHDLRVEGNASGKILRSSFMENMLGSGVSRQNLKLVQVEDSTVAFNELEGDYIHMEEASCARNRWMFNECRGTGDKTLVGRSTTTTFLGVLPSGSAVYDPPSLVDGDGATTTVAVTGALMGDFVRASFSNNLQGVSLSAWVSSAGTVSVRFQNETGGVVDLGSGTLRVRVEAA